MAQCLYETDFYSWTQQQADLLRQGKLHLLDQAHLVEEIEDLGNRHYDQLESRLVQLVAHRLKWQVQHWQRSNSWRATIRGQRLALEKLLRRNPGLTARIPEAMADGWEEARLLAIAETGLLDDCFPDQCPYSFEMAMNSEFWPDSVVDG
jgi:hypothetical protein